MRMNNWIKYSLGFGIAVLVGACSISTEMDATINREIEATTELKEKAKIPTKVDAVDVIRVKNDIWLGDESIVEYEGKPIPNYLETKEGITLISNRPITLFEIGDMINKITSLKVRYASQLEEGLIAHAMENQPTPETMNAYWADPTKMLVSYRGPLSGLLDEISSRFGIWWKYDNNEIYLYKYVTKTFVLYSLPTKQSLSGSVGGASTNEDDAGSSEISLSTEVELELWENIKSSIVSIISAGSKLTTDPQNGTITVTATPTDIKKVAEYVNQQNNRLARQIAISVKVLQVTVDDSDSYGMDVSAGWTRLLEDGRAESLGVVSAATGLDTDTFGNLAMNLLPGDWNISAAIQALSKETNVNLVTSGTVTTLNNKPAPIQVVRTENYISEVTKTSSGDDGDYDISVETEEIETGFTMSVLPRVLEHGRLLLMFNLTLSDLISLQNVPLRPGADSDNSEYIQNPIIESRGFSQEIALTSGQTLVLTGYERVENTAEKTGVGSADNSLLGGSALASKARKVLVILLTPVVLESPLNPETRVGN